MLRWLVLAVPFIAVALWTRSRVPRWGDAIAHTIYDVAGTPRPAPPPPPIEPPYAIDDAIDAGPRVDVADAGFAPRANAIVARALDGGAKDDGTPITLYVKADAVDKALAHPSKPMHGRTARDAAGRPIGVRLTGISGTGVGLQDGDLITSIEGAPTMDDDTATDVLLSAIARGKSVIHAKLLRGTRPIDLTVEVPLDASAVEKDAGLKH